MSLVIGLSNKASWPARHQAIVECLEDEAVHTLTANLAEQPAVSFACQRAVRAIKGKNKQLDDYERNHTLCLAEFSADQSLALDLALACWWSQSAESRKRRYEPRAFDRLKSLCSALPAPTDFPSITSLQRSSAAYVEIVRSRFNRHLYVIKTVVKGLARREANRCSPSFEAHLLSLGSKEASHVRPVPDLVAAFQSQNSLHIVMEYFPAGDLDQLLHSAGEAGGAGIGLAQNGGLLDESFVKAYATDIVGAVGWCHEQRFAHRDVKPANFLLDRTGHLKLCDFATAAPYSVYAQSRRRVHHFYSCLAGTPDYIAPDILLGEEERLNTLARSDRGLGETYDETNTSFASYSQSRAAEAAPDSEGAYGPEVDWWSVGVVIYEMVYKVVPFWADSIREAHYRIRNHQAFLRFDDKVHITSCLADLIKGLLCKKDCRLGASLEGTCAVQRHEFFQDVDWATYMSAPAPFIPNLEPSSYHHLTTQDFASSPSILHSPGPAVPFAVDESMSMTPESVALSQIYEGELEDFPAFVDSQYEGEASEREDTVSEQEKKGLTVCGTILEESNQSMRPIQPRAVSDPTCSVLVAQQDDADDSRNIDLDWLGFSKLPSAGAFERRRPKTTPAPLTGPLETPAIRRMHSSATILEASPACSSVAASPAMWTNRGSEEGAPMNSTPYGGTAVHTYYNSPSVRFETQPMSPPVMSAATPYSFGRKKSLQRRALELSSRLATPGDGRFVTPSRKPSMPNIASAFTSASAKQPTSVVPTSPYPFPVAARATPGTLDRRRGLPVGVAPVSSYRMPSQSPRSSSGVASMGSESRCSGASNAKRDVSENEAMEQLVHAVAQSARKVRIASEDKVVHDRLSALENQLLHKTITGSSLLDVRKLGRPKLRHSHTDTDSEIQEGKVRLLQQTAFNGGQHSLQRRETIAGRSVLEPSHEDSKDATVTSASGPRTIADHAASNSIGEEETAAVWPSSDDSYRVAFPTSPSPVSSVPASISQAKPEASSQPRTIGSTNSTSSYSNTHLPPAWTERALSSSESSTSSTASFHAADTVQLRPPSLAGVERSLRNRRSRRQLKLEAQERTTPTRPTRIIPPQIQVDKFERLSLNASPGGEHKHGSDSTPGLTTDGGTGSDTESLDSASLQSDIPSRSVKTSSPSRGSTAALSGLQSFWDAEPMESSSSSGDIAAKPRLLTNDVGIRHSLMPQSLEAARLRSKSHGQLAKLRLSSSGQPELPSLALNLIQEAQQRHGSSSSSGSVGAPNTLRRKDSREMLSEYRKGIGRPATPTGGLTSPFLPSSLPGTPESLPGVTDEDDAFGGRAVVPTSLPPSVRGLRKPIRRASSATLGQSYAQGKGVMAGSEFEVENKETQAPRSVSGPASFSTKDRRSSASPLMPSSSSSRNSLSLLSISEDAGDVSKKSLHQPKPIRRAKSRLSIMTSPAPRMENDTARASVVGRGSSVSLLPPTLARSDRGLGGESTSSPLSKMDHRFGGLQNSFDGLQSRISEIKARLQG